MQIFDKQESYMPYMVLIKILYGFNKNLFCFQNFFTCAKRTILNSCNYFKEKAVKLSESPCKLPFIVIF